MQHAVICTLDGISYEASFLQASLELHGRTPTNIPVARGNIANALYPNTNLQNAINCYNKGEPEEECYRCEITGRTMQSAVFCKLDQHSYDETAIREYLQTHRQTPSGITLRDGIQIDDVLVPNLALRNAIGSYNQLENNNATRNSFVTCRQ